MEANDAETGKTYQIQRDTASHGKGNGYVHYTLVGTGASSQLRLTVSAYLTHALRPYPPSIKQSESQLVVYTGTLYVLSPYPTESETTIVKLVSNKIESYTMIQSKVSGDEIKYGPFEDIAPYTNEELTIHSENNTPFAVATRCVREIEISQWGNIAVTEWYELRHDGATLKGHFSRQEYQKGSSSAPASFRSIEARLPLEAREIYYRDRIGNISTSHVRDEDDALVVEIQPRYPMFGGWKIDFKFGYNVNKHINVLHPPA